MLAKGTALFLLLLFISANAGAREPVVSDFDNLFTLKFSFNHNYLNFSRKKLGFEFDSNRPMDIGMGFGYKNLSLRFTVSIPFIYDHDSVKSESFDLSLNYFFTDAALFNGYIKYYEGFHDGSRSTVDLEIFTFGFSGEYIFNKSHSLRSVYNLDRRQAVSNGSFLLGGGVFFSSINSDDRDSVFRGELHFGPNFGYSYTWIIKKDFFVNLVLVTGTGAIKSDEMFSFGMYCLPKFSFGYHGKSWSINFFSDANILISHIGRDNEYSLTSGMSGIVFSGRI